MFFIFFPYVSFWLCTQMFIATKGFFHGRLQSVSVVCWPMTCIALAGECLGEANRGKSDQNGLPGGSVPPGCCHEKLTWLSNPRARRPPRRLRAACRDGALRWRE